MLEFFVFLSICLNIFFLTVLSKNKSKYGINKIQIIITVTTLMIICSLLATSANSQKEFETLMITYHFFECLIYYFSVLAFYELINLRQIPKKFKIGLFCFYLPFMLACLIEPLNRYIFFYENRWASYNLISSYRYTLFYYFYNFVNTFILIYCFKQFYKAEQKNCVLNKSKAYIFLFIIAIATIYNWLITTSFLDFSFNFTPVLISIAYYFTYFIFNSFTFYKYNNLIVESFVSYKEDMIVVIDKNKKIIFINGQFAKVFNLDQQLINGERIDDNISVNLPQDFLNFLFKNNDEAIFKINGRSYKKLTHNKNERKFDNVTIFQCLDITETIEYNYKLYILSTTDPVTGVKNRGAFNTYLNEETGKDENIWNIIFDLDNLKIFNDMYGNEFGDEVISGFSIFLKEVFKDKNDQIFRIGGDEFLVTTHQDNRKIVEEKVNLLYEKAEKFNLTHDYPIMFSTGYAKLNEFTANKTLLYKFADIAMVQSKENGKNQSTYFGENLHQAYVYENELKDDFIRGMNSGEIVAFFQGKYNIKKNIIDSCEALVRWEHKDYGILTPYKFLHIATQLKVISEIDFIVLEKSCQSISRWYKDYNKIIRVSVNLSLESLIRPTLVHDIVRIVKKYGVDPSWISLEILENKVINDFDSIRKIIYELMNYGFKFAIDDFGSGFSNFDTISQLDVDIIKIDKSLIDQIVENENASKNIDNICKIIKSYNRKILVEGVETKEQFEILKNFQVDYIQGYYFSKPISSKEFEENYILIS